MGNAQNTALHILRQQNEHKKRKQSEQVLGTLIGVGLTSLGAWGFWEHNLWIAIPFAFIMGIDLAKSFKEGTAVRFLTLGYVLFLAVGLWFHIAGVALIGAVLFGALVVLGRKSK